MKDVLLEMIIHLLTNALLELSQVLVLVFPLLIIL